MSNLSLIDPLTERELETLQQMSRGLTNREIAAQMFIAISTVRTYINQINSKLDTKNRHEAVETALTLGILTPVSAGDKRMSNLPAQTTRFIGREAEINQLVQALTHDHARLVTIVGPGGMGKTRLALEVAQRLLREFEDGVYFVPFGANAPASDVTQGIAQAVDIQLQPDGRDTVQQLSEALTDERLLLLLDNAEAVLQEAALLGQLLAACPHLHILATSHEPLRLRGEHVLSLDGMSIGTFTELSVALKNEAVQLFMQSARQVASTFVIGADDLTALNDILRLTQGMPLALVLAAAWVELMPLQDVAQEIAHNVDLLTDERVDVPERQHSIRAVFDAAWKRMTHEEQLVLARFAVFSDDATREAAQVITDADPRTLMALVRKSLLRHDTQNKRFGLHNLMRNYAMQKLTEQTENYSIMDSHCDYYLWWLKALETNFKGANQVNAINELADDWGNILAAWTWAVDLQQAGLIGGALEPLRLFLSMKGWIGQRNALIRKAFEAFGGTDAITTQPLVAKLAVRLDRNYAEACLPIAQEHQDQTEVAYCLDALGYQALGKLDYTRAIDYYERSIALNTELDELFYVGRSLGHLSVCYLLTRQQEQATSAQQRSLEIMQEIGDLNGYAGLVYVRGSVAFATGDYAAAERYYGESYTLHHQMDNPAQVGWVSAGLSYLAFLRGDFDNARSLADEAIDIASNMDRATDVAYRGSEAVALSVMGHLATLATDFVKAERFYALARPFSRVPSSMQFITHTAWGEALLALQRNQVQDARQRLRKVLKRALEQNNPGAMSLCLPLGAVIFCQAQQWEQAAQLIGAIEQDAVTATGWLTLWPLFAEARKALQAQLGETAYADAKQSAAQMPLQEISTALQDALADPA